jgi:hypothetical protein
MDPSAEPWEDHRIPSADEKICLSVSASSRWSCCNAHAFFAVNLNSGFGLLA